MWLSGCSTGLSDSSAEINKVNYPLIVKYDQAMLDRASVEIKEGLSPALAVMVVDYGQMRDETRVLLGEKVDVDR